MAFSDCEKCWNTPCSCGCDYRNMTKQSRIALASVVLGVDPQLLKKADIIPEKHPMYDPEKKYFMMSREEGEAFEQYKKDFEEAKTNGNIIWR